MDLKKIVRENIYNLTPYSCARTEFSGKASVWIDAFPLNSVRALL